MIALAGLGLFIGMICVLQFQWSARGLVRARRNGGLVTSSRVARYG